MSFKGERTCCLADILLEKIMFHIYNEKIHLHRYIHMFLAVCVCVCVRRACVHVCVWVLSLLLRNASSFGITLTACQFNLGSFSAHH